MRSVGIFGRQFWKRIICRTHIQRHKIHTQTHTHIYMPIVLFLEKVDLFRKDERNASQAFTPSIVCTHTHLWTHVSVTTTKSALNLLFTVCDPFLCVYIKFIQDSLYPKSSKWSIYLFSVEWFVGNYTEEDIQWQVKLTIRNVEFNVSTKFHENLFFFVTFSKRNFSCGSVQNIGDFEKLLGIGTTGGCFNKCGSLKRSRLNWRVFSKDLGY